MPVTGPMPKMTPNQKPNAQSSQPTLTYPPLSPSVITISPSMRDFGDVAQLADGDPSSSEAIANGNSFFAGKQLRIPQFIATHNNVQTSAVYGQFMGVIIGNLTPVFKMKAHSIWIV